MVNGGSLSGILEGVEACDGKAFRRLDATASRINSVEVIVGERTASGTRNDPKDGDFAVQCKTRPQSPGRPAQETAHSNTQTNYHSHGPLSQASQLKLSPHADQNRRWIPP